MKSPFYEPHDPEMKSIREEAREFASTIWPWDLKGGGTYREKRPGLGITIIEYVVDASVEPHHWSVKFSVQAWRTFD
jgi:hypothetical protein